MVNLFALHCTSENFSISGTAENCAAERMQLLEASLDVPITRAAVCQ